MKYAHTPANKPVSSLDLQTIHLHSSSHMHTKSQPNSARNSHTDRLCTFNLKYAKRHADQVILQDIQSFKYDKDKFNFNISVDLNTAQQIFKHSRTDSDIPIATTLTKTNSSKSRFLTRPSSRLTVKKSPSSGVISNLLDFADKPQILISADNIPDKDMIWTKLNKAISSSESTTQRARMIISKETHKISTPTLTNSQELLEPTYIQSTADLTAHFHKLIARSSHVQKSESDTKLFHKSSLLHPKPWKEASYLKFPSLEKPGHRRLCSENLDYIRKYVI